MGTGWAGTPLRVLSPLPCAFNLSFFGKQKECTEKNEGKLSAPAPGRRAGVCHTRLPVCLSVRRVLEAQQKVKSTYV